MIELTLQSGEEIKLPMTVDDAPAKAWFEMSARERELEKLGTSCEPSDFIRYITEAVKAVVDIPDSLLFGLPARSLKNKEWELKPEFIASVKSKGVETVEATVLNIYRHLLWVVRSFQPCDFPVEYAGEMWQMTPNLKKVAYPGEYTAQETVEVLRLEQMFEAELAEARKQEFDFTKIAAADYGLTNYQIAILFRPLDTNGVIEPLPMGEAAFLKFADERVEELKDLPYSVILSVKFFFLNFLTVASVLWAATASLSEPLSTPRSG